MTTHKKRVKRSADEARSFDRFSEQNAATLAAAAELRGCDCEPYADWFTLPRWNDQGFMVKKGEKAVRIGVVVHPKSPNEEPPPARYIATNVFCRCQVQKLPERNNK